MQNTAPGFSEVERHITLSIDAMGGDDGPAPIIAGLAIAARSAENLDFIVYGDESLLRPLIDKNRLTDRCDIVHCDGVVKMSDKPSQVVRQGRDTSMWAAVTAVKSKKALACVSCGNTGALMAVSMLRLRKLAGVNRPAIGILWPSENPSGFNVMLDVGADIRADEADLLQYALMGASYARNGFGMTRPRIGLLNVGTEENKGRAELKIANEMIQETAAAGRYDYIGFVEGGDIPSDRVDVIVTDGFTGNIALKSAEGTATFVINSMRQAFKHSFWSRLSAIWAVGPLRRFARKIDPRRVNGGVFLGLNGTVVKSHGSADATGFAAAVNLAYRLAIADFHDKLAARVATASGLGTDLEDEE